VAIVSQSLHDNTGHCNRIDNERIYTISYDVHPFLPWFDHHLSLSCLVQGLAVMDVLSSPYRADCMDAFHLN